MRKKRCLQLATPLIAIDEKPQQPKIYDIIKSPFFLPHFPNRTGSSPKTGAFPEPDRGTRMRVYRPADGPPVHPPDRSIHD